MSVMKRSALSRAMRQFYKTTTLHGLKYLLSKHFTDRMAWLFCCCASAWCAGLLCTAFWRRFLEVPALITLEDWHEDLQEMRMPAVAICPSTDTIEYLSKNYLTMDEETTSRLPTILDKVLQRKPISKNQRSILQNVLTTNNSTLTQLLYKLMPPCRNLVRHCRWQTVTVNCRDIFSQQMTQWGFCCVMQQQKPRGTTTVLSHLDTTMTVKLELQCSNGTAVYGCKFFTKYSGEDWVQPVDLAPGYIYFAFLRFTSVQDSNKEKLVDDTCVLRKGYTRSDCLIKCTERLCGCLDPLQSNTSGKKNALPTCSIDGINCLRRYGYDNLPCNCLQSCKKITTDVSTLQAGRIVFFQSYDSNSASLNTTLGTILNIRVRILDSKIFNVSPTETWITLLSSLGGVFNMFLGVGFFSAYEFIFLIFVRLPVELRWSKEIFPSNHP